MDKLLKSGYVYVVDADLKSYFDTLDHAQLRELLQRRVRDGVLLRLIGKWLKAGVLEPEKTRLVPFRRPRTQPTHQDTSAEPPAGVFDLLGFRHYWARSRRGNWVVTRKTAPSRFRPALMTIAQWCRRRRHDPIPAQHYTPRQKLRGHYAYYGLTGNGRSLKQFWHVVHRLWRHWLSRRNSRGPMPWPIFEALLQRFPLPPTKQN